MKTNNWIAFIAFVICFIFICFVCLSGCEVIKAKRSISSDSTTVKTATTAAVDTSKGGSVKTNTTKEEFDWYKMTQLFNDHKPAPGDTKVYPTAVIYEGGKGSKESSQVDSTWYKIAMSLLQKNNDSTNVKSKEETKDKQSESKGLGVWLIVICFAGYWLLTKGIPWVIGKYFPAKKLL